MDENHLKVIRELKDSLEFFCEGLESSAESIDLLERYDHYFEMYCHHFKLVMKTWYDLRIAIRDAQVYLMMQPQFVRLVVTPYDYMHYIDVLDGIVTIYQRCGEVKIKTKK